MEALIAVRGQGWEIGIPGTIVPHIHHRRHKCIISFHVRILGAGDDKER